MSDDAATLGGATPPARTSLVKPDAPAMTGLVFAWLFGALGVVILIFGLTAWSHSSHDITSADGLSTVQSARNVVMLVSTLAGAMWCAVSAAACVYLAKPRRVVIVADLR